MIKPTIGRVVWFHPAFVPGNAIPGETHAALVTYVHSDTLINLAVFNAAGGHYSQTSVLLFQGEGERPAGVYAEWMPFQVGQAKAQAAS